MVACNGRTHFSQYWATSLAMMLIHIILVKSGTVSCLYKESVSDVANASHALEEECLQLLNYIHGTQYN